MGGVCKHFHISPVSSASGRVRLPCLSGRLWERSSVACWTDPCRKLCRRNNHTTTVRKTMSATEHQHAATFIKQSNERSPTPKCTIGPSVLASFLGKVGHLLITPLHHLTINHESDLGTTQQKHRLIISCSGRRSKSFASSIHAAELL